MYRPNLHEVTALKRVRVREGVELRPLTSHHADAILEILTDDPTIRERVSVAAAMHTRDDVVAQAERAKHDDTLLRYVLCENEKVVGMVTFWRAGEYFGDRADPDDHGFGYFLAPAARGRGLVTNSLRALMDIGSRELGATTFIAFCEADNASSGAVLERVGLLPTGDTWQEPNEGWIEQKYQRKIQDGVQ